MATNKYNDSMNHIIILLFINELLWIAKANLMYTSYTLDVLKMKEMGKDGTIQLIQNW